MRTVKEPEVRKEEILTRAVDLFAKKGFRNTSINEIIEAEGIAKGTFYYYFKSKESILDEAINIYCNRVYAKLKVVLENNLDPVAKFINIIEVATDHADNLKTNIITALHQPGNELFHEKSLISSVNTLSPIIIGAIKEGNEKNVFSVEYPETTAQLLVVAAQFSFDERLFNRSYDTTISSLEEFIFITEKMLGVEKNTFHSLVEFLSKELI